MITVVAGVMEQDGRVFICRRRETDPHPLKWEFPGGKAEPGETPAAALARELHEELAINAEIGCELMRYEFAYPGKPPVLLIFLQVVIWSPEPANRIFSETAWELRQALASRDFLEGDHLFLTWYSRRETRPVS